MDDITSLLGRKISEQEIRIIDLVGEKPHTLSEISKALKLDYKNTWRYCNNLHNKGVISLNPPPGESKRGSPVNVTMTINAKGDDVIYSVLERIRAKGGRISLNDFYVLISKTRAILDDSQGREKLNNLMFLELCSGFLKKELVLTDSGKNFLKKEDRKRKLKALIKRKINKLCCMIPHKQHIFL